MKLQHKLLLAQTLCMIAVLGATSALQVRAELATTQEDTRRDQATLARVLARVGKDLERGGPGALEVLARSEGGGAQARVLAADDAALRTLPREAVASLARGDTVFRADPVAGVFVTLAPLAGADGRLGAVEVREQGTPRREQLRERLREVLGATLLLFLLSSLATVWLWHRLVAQPSVALQLQLQRIGTGDLTGRLRLRRDSEIGAVARAIDDLSEALTAARERAQREAAARARAEEQLRHADRLATVGKLASGVAHELGTPLQIISGRAAMILETGTTLETARSHARIIGEQTGRVVKIIRQLLDFARQRPSPGQGQVDLRALAEHAVMLLRPLARKAGVGLAVEHAEQEVLVRGDSGQLQQALTNVIVNAVQATPPDGAVAVRIATGPAEPPAGVQSPAGTYAHLVVHDTGQGMPPEVLTHAFEPFFTTKEVGVGTGLGLSVAWGLMRDHGGWIDLASSPGSGTTVTLLLPCPEAPAAGGDSQVV